MSENVEMEDGSGPKEVQHLAPGAVVRVQGVKALKHLNGKEGTCGQYDGVVGKWSVFLCNGETKKMKPEHLVVIKAAPPNHAAGDSITPLCLRQGKFTEMAEHFKGMATSPLDGSNGLIRHATASHGSFSRIADKGKAADTTFAEAANPAEAPEHEPTAQQGSSADKQFDHLASLEKLAREETEMEQRLFEKNRGAVIAAREAAVPSLAEILAQLDAANGEAGDAEDEVQSVGSAHAALQRPMSSAPAGPPRAYGPGLGDAAVPSDPAPAGPTRARGSSAKHAAPLQHAVPAGSSNDEAPGDAVDGDPPSLEAVLATLDEAEVAEDARAMFFQLGTGAAPEREEVPQDPLSKIIRLTSGALDPKAFMAQHAAPTTVAFQSRQGRWLRPEDVPRRVKHATRAARPGCLDEAPLFASGQRRFGSRADHS